MPKASKIAKQQAPALEVGTRVRLTVEVDGLPSPCYGHVTAIDPAASLPYSVALEGGLGTAQLHGTHIEAAPEAPKIEAPKVEAPKVTAKPLDMRTAEAAAKPVLKAAAKETAKAAAASGPRLAKPEPKQTRKQKARKPEIEIPAEWEAPEPVEVEDAGRRKLTASFFMQGKDEESAFLAWGARQGGYGGLWDEAANVPTLMRALVAAYNEHAAYLRKQGVEAPTFAEVEAE